MRRSVVIGAALIVAIGMGLYFFHQRPRIENDGKPDSANEPPVQAESPVKPPVGLNLQDPFVVGSKQRLWHELPFALIKSRAESGDPEAQWYLSEMYGYCFSYNLKPGAALAHWDQIASIKPQAKANIERIKKQIAERCATVDDGKPIPPEAMSLWLEQSAKQGFLQARLRSATMAADIKPEELRSLVGEIKGQSPQAVFEMGTLARKIEPNWDDAETAGAFSKGNYAQYAWELAACRSGLDCSQSSSLMYWMCQQGACAYQNYEQYVFSELVPPAGREPLEKTIRLIQEKFL
jgi:hypothetical protein